ncbi:cupin domain-containing protein [Proteinivorax hydrogeniformans]|uniref:Cupin domain-containing protein n=1 Tax=Proteinivorax hydrogeniformans TaxID=1826727 RepID=A0AAU8HUA7_9FIRM
MKKLIRANDVEEAVSNGVKEIAIKTNTIITPSAKDIAQASGVKFVTHTSQNKELTKSESSNFCQNGLDSEMVYNVFKTLMEKGMLEELLNSLSAPKKFTSESVNGLKVIRGNTVKYDTVDTNCPNSKVYCQELINSNESNLSAGFLKIEQSKYDLKVKQQEINHVIEGSVTTTIDGKSLAANPGDVIYIPSGSQITRESDNAKLLYVTYPASKC